MIVRVSVARKQKHSLHLHAFWLKVWHIFAFAKTEEDNRNLVLHIELVSPTVGGKPLWCLVTECGCVCERIDNSRDFYMWNSNHLFKTKELNLRNSRQHSLEHGPPYADLVLRTWCAPLPEHQWRLPATYKLKYETTVHMTFSIFTYKVVYSSSI